MQDRDKLQGDRIKTTEDAGAGVIVSSDTRRAERLPPNQARTRKYSQSPYPLLTPAARLEDYFRRSRCRIAE